MAGTIGKLRSKLPKVESMHLLSEQDRAKKDYGKVELEDVLRGRLRKSALFAAGGRELLPPAENRSRLIS